MSRNMRVSGIPFRMLIALWVASVAAPVSSFAQQSGSRESRGFPEGSDVGEGVGSPRVLMPPAPKVNAVTGRDSAGDCADCPVPPRDTLSPEERRQLRRDIHEAGRKIYPRHSRNPSKHP